ncbi:PEP-CTERM sorting domain-containing protein [Marinobacter sp.]|uniref:PEP-CTERM sorting domain-containing protein n=1 Tax=Marinobacter sp. TaxID=50741 RepID=UPI003850F201
MKRSAILPKVILGATVLMFSLSAHALLLSPGTTGVQTSNETSASMEEQLIKDAFGISLDLELYYKEDFDEGEDATASFADSYMTSWILDTAGEPTGADITNNGLPSIVCPSCYAAVKDGNQEPAYYFFDISSWDGLTTLEFRDFWLGNGAISHIAIWGNVTDEPGPGPTPVPEPSTLVLLGLGLAGLSLARRKTKIA